MGSIFFTDIGAKDKSIDFLTMNLYFEEKIYRKIEYVARMTSIEFLINLVNIWNFWHGTSFLQVFALLASFSTKITSHFRLPNINFNTRSLIKIFSLTLATIFTGKLISLTMDYLQFNTNTKLNLIDYPDDVNYPYVSFVLVEPLVNFPFNLINLESNFKLVPNNMAKLFGHLNKIKNEFYDDRYLINNNYTTLELAEYWLEYFNATHKTIMNKKLLENYYLDGASIFFAENHQSQHYNFSISYGTNIKL